MVLLSVQRNTPIYKIIMLLEKNLTNNKKLLTMENLLDVSMFYWHFHKIVEKAKRTVVLR